MSAADKALVKTALFAFLADRHDATMDQIRAAMPLDFSATTLAKYVTGIGWTRRPGDGRAVYDAPGHWPRASGRTWRALAALPDGAIYFIGNAHERGHCERILRAQGRARDAIEFVIVARGVFDCVRARRGTPHAVDHAVADHPGISSRDRAELVLAIRYIEAV